MESMTTMMYFILGVTLGAIPIMILWYRNDKDLKLVDNFTFTEKKIYNKRNHQSILCSR